ncbi:DEAD/DEAH box helicase family protein [Clostridia bacterium OttesenSCG-928-F22]|nr:DEAD/DEAH box helicase family protein [Clostridia bacterium OttesenSCG-928-F22]
MDSKKKLNLEWVTDIIGDDYKKWNEGDVVIIESQTGTGKTHFIKNILIKNILDSSKKIYGDERDYDFGKKLLFICNRTNLKRQIKKDLLKLHKQEIPSTIEELDEITTIGRITVTSYQAIEEFILDEAYIGTKNPTFLLKYDYLVLDECHYIFSDSSFNNKTRLVFKELIELYYHEAVKIFITATMNEIIEPVEEHIERIKPTAEKFLLQGRELTVHTYSTGIDYSYIGAKYFSNIETIVQIIKNDTSDDKWIVFVGAIKDGENIKSALGEDAVFIKSGTKNKELDSIIKESKFSKKVLIATKTLDNGINIDDEKVKNIVIMTWDRITFIQMLGRKRIDIENADTVNLYIPTRKVNEFEYFLEKYKTKLTEIVLCRENEKQFCRKYDNDLKAAGELNELFYIDRESRKWMVNPIGEKRLLADIKFMEYMIDKFDEEGSFAFIKEQLLWIELEDTFDEKSLIENDILKNERESLEKFLEQLFLNKEIMYKLENRQELIEKINLRDGKNKNRLVKGKDALNGHLRDIGCQYFIKQFETSQTIDGNKKSYKAAWRIKKYKTSDN